MFIKSHPFSQSHRTGEVERDLWGSINPTASLMSTSVALQAALFPQKVISNTGEHVFVSSPHPYHPTPAPNYRFCKKGFKHDQLKLKYVPVMANTGFNSDQYTDRALRQHELEELRLMLYICLVLQRNSPTS